MTGDIESFVPKFTIKYQILLILFEHHLDKDVRKSETDQIFRHLFLSDRKDVIEYLTWRKSEL